MKLFTAMLLGLIIALIVPLMFGGRSGLWVNSWAGWGTIRPLANSPGLLLSIPLFLGSTFVFRLFFNWHTR